MARGRQLPVLFDLLEHPTLSHLEEEMVDVLLELRIRIEAKGHRDRYLVIKCESDDPSHPRAVESWGELDELGISLRKVKLFVWRATAAFVTVQFALNLYLFYMYTAITDQSAIFRSCPV